MPELFVELLSEEIPARLQRRAADDLRRLVTGHLVDAGLIYEGAYATATPRRLVLSVAGLPPRSPDRIEERRGPRVGAPDKAIDGFVRAAGFASIAEATVESDAKKGEFYVARTTVPGRPAIELAGEAIAEAVRRFPWPASMRWGAASSDPAALRWVRPLTSIVATFGAENEDPDIVPVPLADVPVGDTTVGHRVHAPEPIRVRRLGDYRASLERAHVVVDLDRRRDQILHDARDKVFALGLELVEDEALLEEVAGLVEWPVVLVGRFDEASLALPDEVIRLTIRENQKCFVTRDPATGGLATAFVLTANLDAADGGAAIVAGNERVVRARLADARFFWEQDRRLTLDEHARQLASVTFHEKLGSQADRVERIAALARRIAPAVGADPDVAERAARLAKADLVTQMVGEFPELQGYMGRRYAEEEGLPADVAAAIEEHYAPQGPGDAVPRAPTSVAVALADKFDTLILFWLIGDVPTGSRDPFALRRSALGLIRLILSNNLPLSLFPFAASPAIDHIVGINGASGSEVDEVVRILHRISNGWPNAITFVEDEFGEKWSILREILEKYVDLREFILDRLKIQLRENGARHDLVEAIIRTYDHDDLVGIVARVEVLAEFIRGDDGRTLMAGYKRAANILRVEEKKDGVPFEGEVDPVRLVEAQEVALFEAIKWARYAVADAIGGGYYTTGMQELAKLRRPVDDFFDAVMVNADDPALRINRLRLLAALRDVTRLVADFSAISG